MYGSSCRESRPRIAAYFKDCTQLAAPILWGTDGNPGLAHAQNVGSSAWPSGSSEKRSRNNPLLAALAVLGGSLSGRGSISCLKQCAATRRTRQPLMLCHHDPSVRALSRSRPDAHALSSHRAVSI